MTDQETQRCGSCKQMVPLDGFSPSYRGKTGTWCRACFAAYNRGERVVAEHEHRMCEWCGTEYAPRCLKPGAKFCSRECKTKYRNARAKERRKASIPQRTCPHCGVTFSQSRQPKAKFCSDKCGEAARNLVRKLNQRGGNVPDDFTRLDVYGRDGWTCGICGNPIDPALAHPDHWFGSIDHIIQVAHGGTSELHNLRAAHLICNMSRPRLELQESI